MPGRALEDCYALNRKADRAAVFAGWREMNDYMRENKIDAVAPQLGAGTELAAKPAQAETGDAKAAPEAKAAKPAPGKRSSARILSRPDRTGFLTRRSIAPRRRCTMRFGRGGPSSACRVEQTPLGTST